VVLWSAARHAGSFSLSHTSRANGMLIGSAQPCAQHTDRANINVIGLSATKGLILYIACRRCELIY